MQKIVEEFHIGFTGSRYLNLVHACLIRAEKLSELLRKAKLKYPNLFLHHGDCIGGDRYADLIAKRHHIKTIIHPPALKKHRAWCTGAYFIHPMKRYLDRNKDIVNCSNILIAMPKDIENEELRSGTWSTIRYARKKGIQVVLI